MPRSRNIKPAFFKNEDLAEIGFPGRLLFIGLWTLADLQGLLEYRPKRIKAELFPYDDIDINGYLTVLERLEFIQILCNNDQAYIYVKNFSVHQNPHKTEKTKLPDAKTLTLKSISEITVTAPLSNGYCPADSLNLIPDSLSSDSLLSPAPKNQKEEKKNKQEKKPHKGKINGGLFKDFETWYTKHCPNLTPFTPLSWTQSRFDIVRAAWESNPDAEYWESYFEECGQRKGLWKNNNDWVADMFWLLKPDSIAKIAEGKFCG